MAITAQVPIVPIVFSSYTTFLDKKLKIFNSSEVIIEALPPLSTTGLTHDNIDQLIQKCRQVMLDKYLENTQEIQLRFPHSVLLSNTKLSQ